MTRNVVKHLCITQTPKHTSKRSLGVYSLKGHTSMNEEQLKELEEQLKKREEELNEREASIKEREDELNAEK